MTNVCNDNSEFSRPNKMKYH